jgi:hypothetical protein
MTGPVVSVYLEEGKKKVFACAIDWPGWCRSGRDEDAALETLASTAARYAVFTAAAGIEFPLESLAFDVVERVPGSPSTDFGVPWTVRPADDEPMTPDERDRTIALLEAGWRVFAGIVEAAPAELRKGPRGGGRDRDAVAGHVVGAEIEYHRKLGFPRQKITASDVEGVRAMRADIVSWISSGEGRHGERGWPPRYAARRIAWHVIDHAWEIEDKSV